MSIRPPEVDSSFVDKERAFGNMPMLMQKRFRKLGVALYPTRVTQHAAATGLRRPSPEQI